MGRDNRAKVRGRGHTTTLDEHGCLALVKQPGVATRWIDPCGKAEQHRSTRTAETPLSASARHFLLESGPRRGCFPVFSAVSFNTVETLKMR